MRDRKKQRENRRKGKAAEERYNSSFRPTENMAINAVVKGVKRAPCTKR